MNQSLKYLGQGLTYALFAIVIGYFSTSPAYEYLPADYALVKLSFSHAAQRKGACRERTDEEMAKLPTNMRIRKDCPRERSDVVVELEMDGKLLYHVVLPPAGVSKDGEASIYRSMPIPAGTHQFVARLKDREGEDFNFVQEQTVAIQPGRVMVIDFQADAPGARGFIFKN